MTNYHSEKFKETNPFTLETIVIKNPDKWKVAKLPDFLLDDFVLQGGHKTTLKSSLKPQNAFEDKSLNVENSNLINYEDEEDVIIINETVKVVEYAPDAFRYLRDLDQIT